MWRFDGHTTIIGQTRSGKTYATKHEIKEVREGVLFFNTQLEDMPKGYIKADSSNTFSQIKKALRQGRKINYLPDTYEDKRNMELSILIQSLFRANFNMANKIYLAVDEVHIYDKKDIIPDLRRVATGGLRFGINGLWISQRPALIDNTLMTQSKQMVIFNCSMENQYFKRYNIPYDKIDENLSRMGLYSYCIYDWRDIYPNKPYKGK